MMDQGERYNDLMDKMKAALQISPKKLLAFQLTADGRLLIVTFSLMSPAGTSSTHLIMILRH